jgi:DNA-binding GntR family transcriptional regulator
VAPQHKSKTALAVEALRDAILAGELTPGEPLSVRGLAQQLQMSITPVREALRFLQADGLVSYDEHRAISAVELSPQDADEVYVLRSLLESLATEWAVRRCTDDDVARIERAQAELEAAVAIGDEDRAHRVNRDWHFALYQASGSRYALAFITRLWVPFAWNTIWRVPGQLQRSVAEHAAITAAVRAREPERAAELLRDHLRSARTAVAAYQEHGRADGPSEPR